MVAKPAEQEFYILAAAVPEQRSQVAKRIQPLLWAQKGYHFMTV